MLSCIDKIITYLHSKFINRQRSAIKRREVTEALLRMELKCRRFFELLVGLILSFADPITDILTLVEYAREEHVKWFRAGLLFVVLPCLCYSAAYWYILTSEHDNCRWVKTLLCASHPFAPAFMRLKEFFGYLKKMKRVDAMNSDSNAEARDDDILSESHVYVMLESLFESAPQFLIQLYIINVQEEPATVIQIISLPVSFLSVAWAFATVDDVFLDMDKSERNGDTPKVSYKFTFFLTQVLLLSGRLVSICYFTLVFQQWVWVALFYHTCLLAIGDTVWLCIRSCACTFWTPFAIFFWAGVFNSLRDDSVILILGLGKCRKYVRRRQLICNVLFILENFVMILCHYFMRPFGWYSLALTVVICLLSVIAAVIRVKLYRFLYKDLNEEIVDSQTAEQQQQSAG